MTWKLSARSLAELKDVHPDLVKVVRAALELSPVDFAVYDGLRTVQEQAKNMATGASQTMNSKHLKQSDGFAHAVDLVPFVAGAYSWAWDPIYKVADAMRAAARALAVPITWGCAWDTDFSASTLPPEQIAFDYAARRRALNKKAFLDGPHFELRVPKENNA